MAPVKLNFIVPGFSKCGTTTLCSLLAEHPEIFIPKFKEPNFFSAPDYEQHWGFYESLFNEVRSETTLGEGSTFYSNVEFEELARQRIIKNYPDIKLIFIARDPIARIESSFREMHHSGPKFGLDAPFELEEALNSFPNIINDTLYWTRLNNYRKHLPENQIHVMFLEDLKAQPEQEMDRCFAFLEVDRNFKIDGALRQLNAGGDKLYDSKLLRRIRTSGHTGFKLAKIPVATQDKIFSKIGLRRRFTHPIVWNNLVKASVIEQIKQDIEPFLEANGKPTDFWSRYSKICSTV